MQLFWWETNTVFYREQSYFSDQECLDETNIYFHIKTTSNVEYATTWSRNSKLS